MNHDCENCYHYNFLIHHEAGVFYQCFLGHKLWEDCNDFDAVKEDERMSAERYMVDDAGTVIDKVTLDNYELASELISILNNYENTLNELTEDNEHLRKRVKELELLNNGLNYALKNIKKIDVEIDVGDDRMADKIMNGMYEQYHELVEELYSNLLRQSINATMEVVDNYIEYWSDESVQEFYYDVSPLVVLEELKETLFTGQYSNRMMGEEE